MQAGRNRVFVTPQIEIASQELNFSYARSSGPGGQNVNKVNSKVILRWSPGQSTSVSDGVRARFVERYSSRMTGDGEIIVTSDRFRDQAKNRDDCEQKLAQMIREVAVPPKPRKKTKPSRSSVEKRKQHKRVHGEKKRYRGRVNFD